MVLCAKMRGMKWESFWSHCWHKTPSLTGSVVWHASSFLKALVFSRHGNQCRQERRVAGGLSKASQALNVPQSQGFSSPPGSITGCSKHASHPWRGVPCAWYWIPRLEGAFACECSVVTDSLQLLGLQPASLLCHKVFQATVWSGFPFSSPGNLSGPRMEPTSPALADRSFTTVSSGNPGLKKSHCESEMVPRPKCITVLSQQLQSVKGMESE